VGGSVTNNSVTNLGSMTFSNTAGSYVVSSNALTIGAGGISNNSTNAQTISNALTLGASESFTAGAGSLTIAGNITNAGNSLTINGSNNTLLGGVLGGSGGLTKAGSGTLFFTGADVFSGGLTISSGTVLLGGGDNRLLTNGSVSIAAGSQLNLGTNSQQLSSLTGSGTVTGGAGSLTLAPTNAAGFAGTIAGAEALVVKGNGTLTLSGSNSYTGGTVVSGGTLVASNVSALGGASNSLAVGGTLNLGSQTITQGAVTVSGGTVTNGTLAASSVNLQGGAVAASLGGGAMVTQASGTTTLSGSNSYTGGTVVAGGTLIQGSAMALGSTNGALSITGGSLNLGGFSDHVGSLSLISGAIGNGTVTSASGFTFNGNVSVTATLYGGSGMTTIGSGTVSLGALPSGAIAVNGGTLLTTSAIVGAATNAPGSVAVSSGSLWSNSGTLTVGGSGSGSLTVGSGASVQASGLTIAANTGSKGTVVLGSTNGAGVLSLGSGTIAFGSGNGNLVFNQKGQAAINNAITGKGTITSSGTGTTTLSGNDSGFGGTNYLSSGTEVLGANSQLGGTVTLAGSSATLALNTNSSLTGTGAIGVAGKLVDNSGLAFTNSIKGSVVLASTGELQKTYAAGTSVAGFGAGLGAGKSFSILAGTAAKISTNTITTLDATLTNGALNFKGTFTNAAVMSLIDPSFSAIKNTIQWYNTNTGTWTNTIAGNTGNVIKSGYQGFSGSFSTFLLKTEGLTLTALNNLSASQINADLLKIMGAYGYDSASHAAWAVINHNSIFGGGDGSTLPNLNSLSVSDAPVTADLSMFQGNASIYVNAVPEPGTWALFVLGGIAMVIAARRRQHN
jgi:autotransporter-associated beta strand protein